MFQDEQHLGASGQQLPAPKLGEQSGSLHPSGRANAQGRLTPRSAPPVWGRCLAKETQQGARARALDQGCREGTA